MSVARTVSRIHAQPNVTPMIDVMLVLLIIFMVVTPVLVDGFSATAPQGQNLSKHPTEDAEAVIGIDDKGRLYFNKRPITAQQLRTVLLERFTMDPNNRLVYLRADANVEFQRVQDILAVAADAGARVVGMVADEPKGRTALSPRPK